jgi:hypothetical protein
MDASEDILGCKYAKFEALSYPIENQCIAEIWDDSA